MIDRVRGASDLVMNRGLSDCSLPEISTVPPGALRPKTAWEAWSSHRGQVRGWASLTPLA